LGSIFKKKEKSKESATGKRELRATSWEFHRPYLAYRRLYLILNNFLLHLYYFPPQGTDGIKGGILKHMVHSIVEEAGILAVGVGDDCYCTARH